MEPYKSVYQEASGRISDETFRKKVFSFLTKMDKENTKAFETFVSQYEGNVFYSDDKDSDVEDLLDVGVELIREWEQENEGFLMGF